MVGGGFCLREWSVGQCSSTLLSFLSSVFVVGFGHSYCYTHRSSHGKNRRHLLRFVITRSCFRSSLDSGCDIICITVLCMLFIAVFVFGNYYCVVVASSRESGSAFLFFPSSVSLSVVGAKFRDGVRCFQKSNLN